MKSEDAGDVSPKAGNYLSGETAMILNHICGDFFFLHSLHHIKEHSSREKGMGFIY